MAEPAWLDPTFRTNLIEGDSPRRHSTLLDILIARRNHLVDNPPGQLRSAISSIFTAEPRIVGLTYELISDSLALIEPTWHAAIVGDDDITPLTPETAKEFAAHVAANRQLARDGLQFPTHAAIGELLTEPQLFAVRGSPGQPTEVQLWTSGGWVPLLDAREDDLPLKLSIRGGGRAGASYRRSELLTHMKESFCVLSESVLWPVFFPEKDNEERVSVVLVHASTWRVAGVWAVHTYYRVDSGGSLQSGSVTPVQYDRVMVKPPQHVFNDLLGAVVDQPHTHAARLELVKLCRRARGVGELNIEQERDGLERDIDLFVYNRLGTDDRVAHLQAVYEIARRYLLEGSSFRMPPSLKELLSPSALKRSDLDDLCRACFLAQQLSTQAPWTAQLALGEALLLAERVLSSRGIQHTAPDCSDHFSETLKDELTRTRELLGNAGEETTDITISCRSVAAWATLSAPTRESAASLAVLLNLWPASRLPEGMGAGEPESWDGLPPQTKAQLRAAKLSLEELRD
jgi:hypothetical protein